VKKNTFEKTWLNLRNPTMEDQNISVIQLHQYNHASAEAKGWKMKGWNKHCLCSK